LASQREEIDRELGIPVRWENDGEQRWISISKRYPGELLTAHRAEVGELLADWTNRFITTFRPRLEALVRERVQA